MTSKPKLSIYNVIKKSFIVWGIKINEKVPVYYEWQLAKRNKTINTPSIIVDYKKNIKEWHISFIDINNNIHSCTIDDVTGTASISSFNFVN